MELSYAEGVDLNMSRNSYAVLEQTERQITEKEIIKKSKRTKGQEIESRRGRWRENKKLRDFFQKNKVYTLNERCRETTF